MTQPKEKTLPEDTGTSPAGAAAGGDTPPASPAPNEAPPAETPAPEAPAPSPREAEFAAEVARLNDRLLRALAEGENMRRRAERDRDEAIKYAVSEFAREVLAVADNLRRALDAIGEEQRKTDEALNALAVGVEMTERALLAVFERFGIKRVDALGQPFDHNFHEALFEIEDKEKPAGTVVQVVESGYTIHNRLLRPAKVGIAKGGPKAGPAESADKAAAEPPKPEAAAKASVYEKKGDGTAGGQVDEQL
jgi:molecular chaperone GrpE